LHQNFWRHKMNEVEYLLNSYKPFDKLEKIDLELFRKFVAEYGNKIYDFVPKQPFITASALVLNESLTKTLVMYHNLHKTFRQFGGKAEGNSNLSAVAAEELKDESGVDGKMLSINPIDIIRWNFPTRIKKGIEYPATDCFDIAFLFMIPEITKIKPNKEQVSDTKWISLEEWRDYHDSENDVVRANPNEQSYNQRTFKKIKMFRENLFAR